VRFGEVRYGLVVRGMVSHYLLGRLGYGVVRSAVVWCSPVRLGKQLPSWQAI